MPGMSRHPRLSWSMAPKTRMAGTRLRQRLAEGQQAMTTTAVGGAKRSVPTFEGTDGKVGTAPRGFAPPPISSWSATGTHSIRRRRLPAPIGPLRPGRFRGNTVAYRPPVHPEHRHDLYRADRRHPAFASPWRGAEGGGR